MRAALTVVGMERDQTLGGASVRQFRFVLALVVEAALEGA